MEQMRSSLLDDGGRSKRWLPIPRKRRQLPNRPPIRRKRQRRDLLFHRNLLLKAQQPLRLLQPHHRSPPPRPNLLLLALPPLPHLLSRQLRHLRRKKDQRRSITNSCSV